MPVPPLVLLLRRASNNIRMLERKRDCRQSHSRKRK